MIDVVIPALSVRQSGSQSVSLVLRILTWATEGTESTDGKSEGSDLPW